MKTFVISAGHSNTDPGAVGNGLKEADIAVELRNAVADRLRVEGHTVFTDGSGTTNDSLRDAIKLIKGQGIALEIHCNAAANASASGVESIAKGTKLKPFCQKLSKAVADVLGEKLRGDVGFIDPTQSARGKLGWCDAGGVILETFFISNPKSVAAYQAKKQEVVSAIVEVLLNAD